MRVSTRVHSDTEAPWIGEERSLKLREMQEAQEYTEAQDAEERRQRKAQAKKR